jgi:NADPH-dependent 2,4-dienoyl-CoA reductase/sulfur reductase-like enzyme/peroxiredoxin family protein/rhodanese-related sulfurtransferase/TusA-related sulfurtransferase
MSLPKRLLIVGGVAGGASAATRARRLNEEAEIVMFERGQHVSFANCGLPYHIAGVIAQRQRLLVQTPRALRRRFRIDVRTAHEVLSIDRQGRTLRVRNLATGQESLEPYDALLLSPGAAPVRPEIPGIDSPGVFTLRSMADMDAIKAAVDAHPGGRALVIGGGYIGLEMAEALRARSLNVALVEVAGQVMGVVDAEIAAPLAAELRRHGVDLHLGASVTAITPAQSGLEVQLSIGKTLPADLVVLATGVRPESHLASAAGLAVSARGGIVVDEHMRTSDEHIYAVGDAVETPNLVTGQPLLAPLAGPANRQGRIAADNIFGRPSVYRQTQGTAICKVFNLAVGLTGLNERTCQRLGLRYEKVFVHPASHASYYPGAAPLTLKLLFDVPEGKILGAQAIGTDGVDKRIDVLATALRAEMSVFDLEDLELSYAPPFGSAKDPINYVGFVAANVLRGDMPVFHSPQAAQPAPDQLLLDVRTPEEVVAGTIPGAVNIPLDQLRSRLEELPRDKEILAFCHEGHRGYLACRILQQNGFRCRNLTGGIRTFRDATAASQSSQPAPNPSSSVKEHPVTAQLSDDAGADDNTPEESGPDDPRIVRQIDARTLQCPGPILSLKREIDQLQPGQALAILAADPGFPADVAAWCHATGNILVDVAPQEKHFRAVVAKALPADRPAATPASNARKQTIVVFSNDLDRALAGFIIANGAAAMGSDVTMFFTFWGLNILRRQNKVPVRKALVERMFGWMMPRGADKLALSKLHMGGLGTAMMKGVMRKKNIASLGELIASARQAGVRLVACTMSMDMMGLKKEELIDGVQQGGVAMYLEAAQAGSVNLFI